MSILKQQLETNPIFPLVSIVIPTYNQEAYITDAINSVISQDYPNIEIIISDDCSTDNTNKIIEEFVKNHKNITHIRNKQNFGRVENYRKCLYSYVNGEISLNLDGDDYLIDDSYISKAVELFSTNDEIVLVFSNTKTYIARSDKYILNKMNVGLPRIIDGNWLFINYFKSYSIPHLTSLHKTEYAKNIGFYNADICGADWESQLRIMLNKKVGFINEYAGVWRKHNGNASRNVTVNDIIKNTSYIDGPYSYAKDCKQFPKRKLDNWRRKLLKRMFFNGLLKIMFLRPNDTNYFLQEIKRYDLAIYMSFISDPRFITLRLIGLNKAFLYWVFVVIIKQEAFIEDLIMREEESDDFIFRKEESII